MFGCLKKEKKMNNRKLILVAFFAVALVQLYIPAKMILDREKILSSGRELKFRAAPVDPNDPFRGKFIVLNFVNNTIDIQGKNEWKMNEPIYVILSDGPDGFAEIKSVSKEKPSGNQDFVKAKVGNLMFDDDKKLTIEYPFQRFYMEETKAPLAEREYNKASLDSTRTTWALVSIKDGEAVLKDVMIDGVSIGKLR
jgi:uncharacterized membrane-anchored protein